ncbi:MAG: PAS domain S-box protein [Opitutae bacterium]|nr:PAS domain S-box protein [Opitutae bacterium]
MLPPKRSVRPAPPREVARLRARLAEAKETLRAIRAGEIDTLAGAGQAGRQVFTLEGAEHAYRVLIESMNEGALTLTRDKMILYANQAFARMVRCPLEQVTGGSFRRFLAPADRLTLRALLKNAAKTGAKILVPLHAADGTRLPVQLSIGAREKTGRGRLTIGMVVTDLTEARRTEELLRALAHRVVQVQEAERSSVALELHDQITQPLCAVLFHSQGLVAKLAGHSGPARPEAVKLRDLLSQTSAAVERISRNLRPGTLELLGLVAGLRAAAKEFAARTGAKVNLAGVQPLGRLPAPVELALYRIVQECFKNVEKHARARRVTVRLHQTADAVFLVIDDDGAGFDADHPPTRSPVNGGLGLLSMRERAAYVGGTLQVKTGRRAGTEIAVCIPVAPGGEVAAAI